MFACAVVVVCAVAVWFAATHSAKCIKYAEHGLVYESEVKK